MINESTNTVGRSGNDRRYARFILHPPFFILLLTGVLALVGLPVEAQTDAAGSAPPDANHLEQLANCREGIVDPEARPEDRRRWMNTLLAFGTPEAKSLVVELLELSDNPEAQRCVCEVIADHTRTAPDRLPSQLIDPLLQLLGSEGVDLRTAAVNALADFPSAELPVKLRDLAAQADVAMVKRLAAIDALASKVDHREVIGALMTLLDAGVPQITERVVAALEPLSEETFGADVARWQAWWDRKSALSDEAWFADQLRMYRSRLRALEVEFEAFRADMERRQATVAGRLVEFQREAFRPLSPEDQNAKLADWLVDPLPEVKGTALAIIRARIADEGRRPTGEVLSALLRLLKEGATDTRQEVLLIVQTLNDPAVIQAVLEQLEREQDSTTRHAMLKAIGKLNSPRAIPALIREVAAPESPPECVREAAIALGQIARGLEDHLEVAEAVPALKGRYQVVADDDPALRSALLTAMAGVAECSSTAENRLFTAEFFEALESDDARLLRPAIRGLRAVGDRSRLPRLRTLMAHADPLVRRAATVAIGEVGGEDADLESVLTRLNPTIEADEGVREAARQAFGELLSTKPVEERLASAARLRDTPDLEVTYLVELANGLTSVNSHTGELEAVYDRIATVLLDQGKYDEAAPYLADLYEKRSARTGTGAASDGGRWLEAALHAAPQVRVADVVTRLATGADEAAQAAIIDTVAAYFEIPEATADAERTRAVLADLRNVPAGTLGEAWTSFLDDLDERFPPEAAAPIPDSSP